MSVALSLRKTSFSSLLFSAATSSCKIQRNNNNILVLVLSLIIYAVLLFRAKNEMDMNEFMFFLTGGVGLENKLKNPAPQWLSDRSWDEICRMSDMKSFSGKERTLLPNILQ